MIQNMLWDPLVATNIIAMSFFLSSTLVFKVVSTPYVCIFIQIRMYCNTMAHRSTTRKYAFTVTWSLCSVCVHVSVKNTDLTTEQALRSFSVHINKTVMLRAGCLFVRRPTSFLLSCVGRIRIRKEDLPCSASYYASSITFPFFLFPKLYHATSTTQAPTPAGPLLPLLLLQRPPV
jgi:uncharacterized membrane protein